MKLGALVSVLVLLTVGLTASGASAAAPTIQQTWSEDVALNEAILKAEVNPEGKATTYHFEFGPTGSYGSNTPELAVGEDNAVHVVTRFLQDLQAGTTYHYRVVATNEDGPTIGPDHVFHTYAQLTPETSCANQAFRYGFSANLADCRAYEMVSPVDKNGGDIRVAGDPNGIRAEYIQASPDGEKITLSSYEAFAGAATAHYSDQYIAHREANSWVTQPISPERTMLNGFKFEPAFTVPYVQFKAFNEDLSRAWFTDITRLPLAPGALKEMPNLYGRDNASGSIYTLSMGEPVGGASLVYPGLMGHTPDGSLAVFQYYGGLTPDSANNGTSELYLHSNGEIELISVLPNGEADPNESFAGAGSRDSHKGDMQLEHAISDDGSRVFWYSTTFGFQAKGGTLYAWIEGQPTVRVSAGIEASFWRADPQGSTVIYSEAVNSSHEDFQDLYEFDVDGETRTFIAGEAKGVVGASEDLSRLYFVSKEALAPGASVGEPNLYLRHEGSIRFIATLSPTDIGASGGANSSPGIANWRPNERSSRVSANGRYVAFTSNRPLTGYDNTDAVTGDADFEVFLYDAVTDGLTCVSCNPSGARPVGKALERPFTVVPSTDFSGVEIWTAASLPTWAHSLYPSRALAENGNRVFFHAFDALVPQDNNGKQDVYQWEAPGTGNCHLGHQSYSEVNQGCVSLVSTGRSGESSELLDASAEGDDVFIRTESSIDARDTYGRDIYNARVGGGYPPPPPPPTVCVGDGCQSPPPPPQDATPASAAFRGAGDPKARKQRKRCLARARQRRAGTKTEKSRARKACRRNGRRARR